jgi:RNA polymerase sigma-70 factor (ECF subfamily)
MFLLDILLWALSFGTLSVIQGESTRAEDPDEQGLLDRASKADPEALGVLYDRYVDRIYNYIYHRVGQADLAEDLTAQVFARMLEAIREGRAWRTSFSGWIYRIAHNLVIDHYRRRGRAAFVELEEASPIASEEADPVRKVEARLESEHLRAALTKLTEEQAEVIALRFLDEFSIAEVASMMNKTEGAIKALQYRAVLALRRVMQPA